MQCCWPSPSSSCRKGSAESNVAKEAAATATIYSLSQGVSGGQLLPTVFSAAESRRLYSSSIAATWRNTLSSSGRFLVPRGNSPSWPSGTLILPPDQSPFSAANNELNGPSEHKLDRETRLARMTSVRRCPITGHRDGAAALRRMQLPDEHPPATLLLCARTLQTEIVHQP
jgi:hypothetical protein